MAKFLQLVLNLVLLCIFSQFVIGATYTVSKVADTDDGTCDADCSLREAVTAANGTVENDVVDFDPSVFSSPQIIILSGTEISITANGLLDINGPGAALLTISGGSLSRIIFNDTGASATINDITFTAGNGVGPVNSGRGGAIYNRGGNLTLNNLVLTGNTGNTGGATNNASSGTMTVNSCFIHNNSSASAGGGMQNFSGSMLIINNSTIANNMTVTTTTGGGGIQANGTNFYTNSTFSGNSTGASGGAIYYNGQGMTMTNVTISNNSAGSATNAGGIHKATSTLNAFLRNNLIAGNMSASASVDATGVFDSNGNNLIGVQGSSSGWIASDLLGQMGLLSPLGDNGGIGLTHLPMPGSPAINAGQNCVVDLTCAVNNPPQAVNTDQRGVTRPYEADVDIGAVEAAAAIVGGRVLSSGGRGIPSAVVVLTDAGMNSQVARTNQFGYFRFSEITAGPTYTVTAFAKGYSFGSQMIQITGNISNIEIIESGSTRPGKETEKSRMW